jgi:hypothetical protein
MNENNEIFTDGQFPKTVYLRTMFAMKKILDMGQFKIGSSESKEFKYFKKVVMDELYNSMQEVFEAMEKRDLVQKCECGTSIRNGYKPCEKCNGSGFRNTEEFMDWINQDATATADIQVTENENKRNDPNAKGSIVS